MRRILPWLGVVLMGMLLAGCGQAPTPAATRTPDTRPTATARAETPTRDPNITPTPTSTSTPTPTLVPTATEVVDYCVECHTDKDSLVSVLKPTEAVVVESEGAG